MDEKIKKIKLRLKLAEDHLYAYTLAISDSDRGDHHFFEEAIVGLRKEVAVLKWALKVLEG